MKCLLMLILTIIALSSSAALQATSADHSTAASTPSDEEIEVLLAAEARRIAGEEIVIVGNGTVNLDPREFLLRQFPHLARRILGSAFGNLNLTATTTTSAAATSTVATTELELEAHQSAATASTPTDVRTSSGSSISPQITTSKPELKLSQLIPNAEEEKGRKENKTSKEAPYLQQDVPGVNNKFSMILPDLSDSGKNGPRPSRISLLPFGSTFLPEFSSSEDARKHETSKTSKLEPPADNPYDSKNFAQPVEKPPTLSSKATNNDGSSAASASILETVTRFPSAITSSSSSRFFDSITGRPYELQRNNNKNFIGNNNSKHHQVAAAAVVSNTTPSASRPTAAVVTLESTVAPFLLSTTASSRSFGSSTPGAAGSLLTDEAIDGAPCNVTELSFDALKDGLELGDYLMIDVRPKDETDITGLIPGSINIPGTKLRDELDLPEYAFERKYQYLKPDPKRGPKLVLTGRNETDMVNVVRQAQASGFSHLWIYPRGIIDWILHEGTTVNSRLIHDDDDDIDRMDEKGEDDDDDGDYSMAESRRKNIYRAIGVDRFDEKEIDYLSYQQLRSLMKQNHQLILIDVRRREAFRRGSIPGAFNLPLHLITFDVPMQPARFNQKYGFTLPSKLALGSVVVFGRDKYDGVGAVKRFRVVGFRVCQVYMGYDDWKKNVAQEEATAAIAAAPTNARKPASLGSAAVASDVHFVTRPPPAVASSTYSASPYPTTTPDPRLLFRSSAAADNNREVSLPITLTEVDIQIIVVGPDAYKIHRTIASLKEAGYRYVTAHAVQAAQNDKQKAWRPLTAKDLKECFTHGVNYIPQGAGSGQQPTVVKSSIGANGNRGGHGESHLTTYRRTPSGLKSPQVERQPSGRTPPAKTLNFQRPHEELSKEQSEEAAEAPTSPGEADSSDSDSDDNPAKSNNNKLKVVKEEVFFKDLLQKIQRGEYKVFEFRSEESVRRDGKIPGSAVLKLWDIPGAVTMQDGEFQSKFGFKKPSADGSDVVVSCDDPQTGREAVSRMRQLGYTRAALLSGCFAQWKTLGGPVQYPMPSRIGPGELALQVRKGAVIIDVGDLKLEGRDPFPRSVNIPVSELRPAFHQGDREFQQRFGFQKVDKNSGAPMILTAANPQMVHDASKVLASLGYHNVRLLYMDR